MLSFSRNGLLPSTSCWEWNEGLTIWGPASCPAIAQFALLPRGFPWVSAQSGMFHQDLYPLWVLKLVPLVPGNDPKQMITAFSIASCRPSRVPRPVAQSSTNFEAPNPRVGMKTGSQTPTPVHQNCRLDSLFSGQATVPYLDVYQPSCTRRHKKILTAALVVKSPMHTAAHRHQNIHLHAPEDIRKCSQQLWF